MDTEGLQRWKEELESERKRQISKVKKFQQETVRRQRAIEMRAQLEQAKEEKRRKQVLAERKAQNVEATMRFQKGVKYFRSNREESLDETPTLPNYLRSRINSTESDRIIVFDKDLAHLFTQPNNNNNRLQRGSSLDNVSHYQQQQPQHHYHYSTVTNRISGLNGNNNTVIKEMIDQNQRHIKEVNKDALNHFKRMITSEIGSDNGTIQTVTDNNDNYDDGIDEIDSMDTDSLLSARFEPIQEDGKKVLTFDRQNGEIMASRQTRSNSDILRPNPISFGSYTNINNTNNEIDLKSGEFMKYADPFHALSTPSSILPSNPSHLSTTTTTTTTTANQTNELFRGVRFPLEPSPLTRKNSSDSGIKSILKRSSSLDMNIDSFTTSNNQQQQQTSELRFGVDRVRDSIELAKVDSDRMKQQLQQQGERRKSVRFAGAVSNPCDGVVGERKLSHDEESIRVAVKETTQENVNGSSRISSTNSIRRPIIKPRGTATTTTTSAFRPPVPSQISKQASAKTTNELSQKPPLPVSQPQTAPLAQLPQKPVVVDKPPKPDNIDRVYQGSPSTVLAGAAGGYSTMNLRRKEFFNNRTSPKLTVNSPKSMMVSTTPPGIKLISPLHFTETNEANTKPVVRRNSAEKVIQYYQPIHFQQQQQQQHQQKHPQSNGKQSNNNNNNNKNGLEYLIAQRPFSSISLRQFVATNEDQKQPQQQRQALYQSPYGELVQPRPIILQQQQQQQHYQPRVHSADLLQNHRNFRNIPTMPRTIDIEIKYPLLSNHQPQYINISKPLRPHTHHTNPKQTEQEGPTGDSMALFLKAEEMANKSYSESQIVQELDGNTNENTNTNTKKDTEQYKPTDLSIEELNLKNSILNLNERLNQLTNTLNRHQQQQQQQQQNNHLINNQNNNNIRTPVNFEKKTTPVNNYIKIRR